MMAEESQPDPARSAPAPADALPSVALLALLKEGEAAARDELVRRYWPRLARWARGRLPGAARDLYETGDLVQETMVAVLDRLPDFDPAHSGALPAYFRAAILNRIRNVATQAHRRGEKVVLDGALADSALADRGPSPLEEVIGQDAIERYERALARLRPTDRDAIQLKIELDLPYEEIARELGKPTLTAARMAVSRALYRLAREMQRHA